MTQKQLVREYIKQHTSICPAKVANSNYNGGWFGSEIGRVCRSLRKAGELTSHPDKDGYEVFTPVNKTEYIFEEPKQKSFTLDF